MAGMIENNCSPFSACVAEVCELKSFKCCTVLPLTALPLEKNCMHC